MSDAVELIKIQHMKRKLYFILTLLFISSQLMAQSGSSAVVKGTPEAFSKTSFNAMKAYEAQYGDIEYNFFKKPNPEPKSYSFEVPESSVISMGEKLNETKTSREVSPAADTTFNALDDTGNSIPPDVNGAPGPDHIMVTLNTQVRIQDRVGVDLGTISLGVFWSSLPGGNTFDPKVLYDFEEDRWILVTCAGSEPGDSRIYLGVSANSDPTGEWYLYSYVADSSNVVWFDYPSMGFNDKWIVISGNMFGNDFYRTVWVFDKHAMYAGDEAPGFTRFETSQGFTLVPAITFDTDQENIYLVSSANGNQGGNGYISLFEVSGEVDDPQFSLIGNIGTPNPWAGSVGNNGNFLPQLGSPEKINAVDHRMENVVLRNGEIWAVHHVFLPADNPQRTAIQYWNLTPTGDILQYGRIDDPDGGMSYAFATVAVNSLGDVMIGHNNFSLDQYASAGYSFRYHTDPPSTFRTPFQYKDGLAPYYKTFGSGRNRWGDYSATMLDPVNSIDFWVLQEYADLPSGGDRWGTWWAYVRIPFQPQPDFEASNTVIPVGEVVDFSDKSIGIPTAWNWSFNGAEPASSTDQNPSGVMYNTEGTFAVELTAENEFGSNTVLKENYITTSSTILPEVMFEASRTSVCTGEVVQFADMSQYLPRSWNWSFDPATVTFVNGTDASSQNPEVRFDEPGSYAVTLEATNLNGSSETTKFDYISAGGVAIPYAAYFEELSFEDAGWSVWNPDGKVTWELTNVQGLPETSRSAVIDFSEYYAIGQRDRLISPAINLQGFEQVNLAFKHAYAKRNPNYSDSLIIYVSADCGESWTRIFGDAEDGSGNFATHPLTEGFVPTNVWDWCGVEYGADCITLSLDEWAGMADIRVAFETFSFAGNPLYITDVELGATVNLDEISSNSERLQIFPNPSLEGKIELRIDKTSKLDKVKIVNQSGQVVFNTEKPTRTLDVSFLPAGVYLLSATIDGEIIREKLVIN